MQLWPSISISALSRPMRRLRPPARSNERIGSPQLIEALHGVKNLLDEVIRARQQSHPVLAPITSLQPAHQLANVL
jgi:hypothetical protein